jgi:hypothetical protein
MQPERQRDIIINDVPQPAAVSHIDLFYLYRREMGSIVSGTRTPWPASLKCWRDKTFLDP